MRPVLLALAVLVPLAVVAQSTTFTLGASEASGTPPQIYVGKSNCGSQTLHFNWDVSSGHPATGEQVVVLRSVSVADCNSTTLGIEICENSLSLDSDEVLTPNLYYDLQSKGYTREELLAVTHTFIGRKRVTQANACVS